VHTRSCADPAPTHPKTPCLSCQDAAQLQQRGYGVAGISESLYAPMRSVATLLAARNATALLEDPDVVVATRTIVSWRCGQEAAQGPANDWVERATLAKAQARRRIIERHACGGAGGDGAALGADGLKPGSNGEWGQFAVIGCQLMQP
jgi:hypothetical protein